MLDFFPYFPFKIKKKIILNRRLKSAAKALLWSGPNLPDERRQQLEAEVLKHYPADTKLTQELLAVAAEIITT